MVEFTDNERAWMREAISLARQGQGAVEPNPMVGCIIVHQGRQIASGYHRHFGGPHAERDALVTISGTIPHGCCAVVTLEPCCHHGKTPPCTDALIEAKFARVIVAIRDPCDLVAGRGIEQLRAAGIQVDCGLEEDAARLLNAPYIKRICQKKPWLIAKWAMTLDGKIATRTKQSQWISGDDSRAAVHRLRGRMDAIVIGIGTALADDPLLTARPAGLRTAWRVVVDSNLRIPESSQLVQTSRQFPVLLWAGPNADVSRVSKLRHLGCHVEVCPEPQRNQRLLSLLEFLTAEYSATNVLVEGGGELLGSLFDLQQVDQIEVFMAPKIVGGVQSVSPVAGLGVSTIADGPQIEVDTIQTRGKDLHLTCRVKYW